MQGKLKYFHMWKHVYSTGSECLVLYMNLFHEMQPYWVTGYKNIRVTGECRVQVLETENFLLGKPQIFANSCTDLNPAQPRHQAITCQLYHLIVILFMNTFK